MTFLLKGGLFGINEGKTCPTGLRRGKHALKGWLGQFRLAINALFLKGGAVWIK